MNAIWIIAKKELTSFFDSLVAYVLLVVFLGLSGFFTWVSGSDVFLRGQVSLEPFFGVAYWTLFFFVPMLTMRMLAEENRTGTIELLQTKSVSDWQIVAGKALACLLLILIALIFTLPYYITLTQLGDVDHGAVLCGYLGLILMSSAYIGIGMFASSVTNNQIVAILVAMFIGVFFLIIFDVISSGTPGIVANVLHYFSMTTHFDSISRGVIDSKDVLYFVLLSLTGLVGAEHVLSKRNIVG
jgi:ABC-2 type transport system permease protein